MDQNKNDWRDDHLGDGFEMKQIIQPDDYSGKVKVPVLLMHSEESVRKGDAKEKYYRADAILDVETISRYGKSLGDDVTEVSFKGGLHDLALSRKGIREEVYSTMLDWLKVKNL